MDGQELEIRPDQQMRQATDVAGACKAIVTQTAVTIQGRKYVRVEGWQSIAIAHGCVLSARGVEKVDGGVRAIGEVRRASDGALLATAEGFVGEDEPTWFGGEITSYGKTKMLPKRSDYAIRAMAQTRAMSRAARTAFAHVVVLMDAGLSTTPAEEIPDDTFEREVKPAPQTQRQVPSNGAPAPHKAVPTIEALRETLDKVGLDRAKIAQVADHWEKACNEHGLDALKGEGFDVIEKRLEVCP